jgi:hypothetical protein
MPWEGTNKNKQEGTNNARLAYVMHVHQPNYKRMQTLLSYANEMDVWHKHWGNAAFTIKIPDKRSSQWVKTKYIQMIQTHGLVQLSMGAASIAGMINVDMMFDLRLLPGADGKPWLPTRTTVREVFSMIGFNEKKVWICLSMGANGMSMGS